MVFAEETSQSNKNSTSSPLFGFIDLFLYLTFFNKIYIFFSSFFSFLLCHFQYGSSESEVREEKKVTESNESNAGIIERDEVKMVMEKMGFVCNSESEELNEKYGSKELCEVFEENEPSLDEVKQAFDVFDENKDGFIDAMELQRVLVILGLKEGSKFENCQKMIKHFDENHDGRIDFFEFVNIMRNHFC
ncbi:probable calcium-binding protein CML46 [Trifolium pratense]|uniref:probable calcium-binding protein CML46 n=1 Tax=Trifolium pratense TaxID=57577 RepID=UPI001E692603|nr:probable calcium-binding protein CML46 [Trifolium pratense]